MTDCLIIFNERDEPVIAGTNVSVAAILEELSADQSMEDICAYYDITREQAHAALAYAETSLPHSQMDAMLSSITSDYDSEDDELDYSLLSACMC